MKPLQSPWRIVAVREIMTKLRDKTFIFSTVFTLVIIAASIIASSLMGSRETTSTIAVVDQAGASIVTAAEESLKAQESKQHLETKTYNSPEAALDAVEAKEAEAALIAGEDGWKLTFATNLDTSITTPLRVAVTSTVTAQNAAAQGVDLQALSKGSQLSTGTLSEKEDKSMIAMMIGLVFAMLFYTAVLVFGQIIAMSVVEEKQNRIVEIIATAIPISQLLLGKIVGNTLLAISQLALYGIVGLTALNLTGQSESFGWILSSVGWFMIFYVTGFVAVTTIWAAVGAMASRTEDIGALSAPITMLLVAVLFVGIYAKGTLLTIVSFIPIASSIAMPIRTLTEDVAVWEPLLALTLTVLATYFLTRLGAGIYRNNIMRGGTAVSWKQALSRKAAA